MNYNIIQLNNTLAIMVDDDEFKKALKKYKFWWGRHIIVKDNRGHEFTFLKEQVSLFERRNLNE